MVRSAAALSPVSSRTACSAAWEGRGQYERPREWAGTVWPAAVAASTSFADSAVSRPYA